MLRTLLIALLLVPALSFADADPRFAALRDKAEPLTSLSGFLDKYVGECADLVGGAECKANAKTFRARANHKKFYMIISEESATMLAPGPFNPGGAEYTVNIAPLFAADGYALTRGAPRRTDAQGNPMMMYLQAKGHLPGGWSFPRFQRLFSTRQLRVQVVFSPKGVWTLPKRGGGRLYGVKADIEAIYVTIGRTGEPVALWLDGRHHR